MKRKHLKDHVKPTLLS
jgi:hypothetical protein